MTQPNDVTHPAGTIEFIQVLRGLAALAVVVLHAGWEHTDYAAATGVRHALTSGIAGVDLFFVISGFIMYCTLPLSAGSWSDAGRFAIKRFTRIWPPYAAWTLIVVAMLVCVPAPRLLLPALKVSDLAMSLAFLPTSLPFIAPAFTLPVLDVGWTLYYEAYFYAVLALCLATGRWRWPLFIGWLAVVTLVIPAVRGAPLFDPNISAAGAPLVNTLTSPIMWEFAAGVAIGWIYQRNVRFPRISFGVLATLLATIYLCAYCITSEHIGHGLSGVGLPIILIVLCLALTPMSRRCAWRPLAWLGKVSFSLYLAHKPVILAMELILSLRKVPLQPATLAAFIAAACLLSIMVAGISYRLLEAGLSNAIRDRLLLRGHESARAGEHSAMKRTSTQPARDDA